MSFVNLTIFQLLINLLILKPEIFFPKKYGLNICLYLLCIFRNFNVFIKYLL